MSDGPKNPYSELMRELEMRGKEIASQDVPVGRKVHDLMALVAEGEQRFAELPANRQGGIPDDLESLYEQKAELDRKLLGPNL
jgi:hypothetical protein